jgi:hypothetical protein
MNALNSSNTYTVPEDVSIPLQITVAAGFQLSITKTKISENKSPAPLYSVTKFSESFEIV